MYYMIVARIVRVSKKGYRSSVGLPTFYLHESMQMITSVDDAERVARSLIMLTMGDDDSTLGAVHIQASEVEL